MSRPSGITYADGSPYSPLGLSRYRPRGCADGAHGPARATTDRDGALVWVCLSCPAWREQGDPTWRTP